MKPSEIETIKQRVEAATAGPWDTSRNNMVVLQIPGFDPFRARIVWKPGGHDVAYVLPLGPDRGNADAAFIARAREDMPKLLKEVEKLRWLAKSLYEWNVYAYCPLDPESFIETNPDQTIVKHGRELLACLRERELIE